jgi:hypothetical protein
VLQVFEAVGLDRLGDWQSNQVFTPRGRYERADPMAGAGRLADWIECSALFGPRATVSRTDATDELVNSGVLQPRGSQTPDDAAEAIVEEVFVELKRRSLLMPNTGPFAYPFQLDPTILRRSQTNWTGSPEYAFLILASMSQLAPWLVRPSYNELGHRFERVVRLSAEGLFGRPAIVLETSHRGADHLKERMKAVLGHFDREVTPYLEAAPKRVRDGGLDVVVRLWNHDADRRPGTAHFLVQCAAGQNWSEKISTPSLSRWRDWVSWRGPIYKALAVPFLFTDDRALHDASQEGDWTLILDRSRLLYGIGQAGGSPSSLASDLLTWCRPMVAELAKKER